MVMVLIVLLLLLMIMMMSQGGIWIRNHQLKKKNPNEMCYHCATCCPTPSFMNHLNCLLMNMFLNVRGSGLWSWLSHTCDLKPDSLEAALPDAWYCGVCARSDRCWRWTGHTLWKPVSCITCKALTWNSQEKRKQGRQRKTWHCDLEAKIKRMRYTWGQRKRLTQDQDVWRALIGSLCCSRDQRQWWWWC